MLGGEPRSSKLCAMGRAHVPRMCPSGAESGGTGWDRVGRDGMANPSKIKEMVGNGASCFRFFHPLGQGSNPFSRSRMKSGGRNSSKGSGRWRFFHFPSAFSHSRAQRTVRRHARLLRSRLGSEPGS